MVAGYEAYYAGLLALRVELGREPEYYPPHGRLARALMTRQKPLLLPSTRRLVYVKDQWKTDPEVLAARMGDLMSKGFQVSHLDDGGSSASAEERNGLAFFLQAIAAQKHNREDDLSESVPDDPAEPCPEPAFADWAILADSREVTPEDLVVEQLFGPEETLTIHEERQEPSALLHEEGTKRSGRTARAASPKRGRKSRRREMEAAGADTCGAIAAEQAILQQHHIPALYDARVGISAVVPCGPTGIIEAHPEDTEARVLQWEGETTDQRPNPELEEPASAVRSRQVAHLVKRLVWRPAKNPIPSPANTTSAQPQDGAPTTAAAETVAAIPLPSFEDLPHGQDLEEMPGIWQSEASGLADAISLAAGPGADDFGELGMADPAAGGLGVEGETEQQSQLPLFGAEVDLPLEPPTHRDAMPLVNASVEPLAHSTSITLDVQMASRQDAQAEPESRPGRLEAKLRSAKALSAVFLTAKAGPRDSRDDVAADPYPEQPETEETGIDSGETMAAISSIGRAFTGLASRTRELVDRRVLRAMRPDVQEKPSQLEPLRRALLIMGEASPSAGIKDTDDLPPWALRAL